MSHLDGSALIAIQDSEVDIAISGLRKSAIAALVPTKLKAVLKILAVQ